MRWTRRDATVPARFTGGEEQRGALANFLAGSAVAFSPATPAARTSVALAAKKSQAHPFMNRPLLLDGSMAGNMGFDPLGLSHIDDVSTDLYSSNTGAWPCWP